MTATKPPTPQTGRAPAAGCGGGDDGSGRNALFNDFLEPAKKAGYSVHLKNLYNLYVYFWRWALWKVFEHESSRGSGIVSFITASSDLDGDAFCGMREQMRRLCDEIYILDLGGEGRGTRKDENVFNIQTPVAIAIALRKGRGDLDKPARVFYHWIEGNRKEKLKRLEDVRHILDLDWQPCPDEWQAPFRTIQKSAYFRWPLLTDLMPWQHSGVQCKRTWVIAPDPEVLKRRWRKLLETSDPEDKAHLFKETRDRKRSPHFSICRPMPHLPRSSATPIGLLTGNGFFMMIAFVHPSGGP